MKIKIFNLSLVILFFALTASNCTDKTCVDPNTISQIDTIYINDTIYIIDTVYITNPELAILGKWELAEKGFDIMSLTPVETPNEYHEYLIDSIYKRYVYSRDTTYIMKYWIDTLLHIGSINESGAVSQDEFEYRFFNKNSLRLVNWSHEPNPIKVYKRIE